MFKLNITKLGTTSGVLDKGATRLRTLSIPKGIAPPVSTTTGARDVGTIMPPTPVLGGRGTINRGVITIPRITGKMDWVQELQDPMTNAFTGSAQRVADTLRSGVISGIGSFKSGFAGFAKMIGESEPTVKGVAIPKETSAGFAKYASTVIANTDKWIKENEPDFEMTWLESKMRNLASAGVSIGLSMGLGLLTKAAGLSSAVFGVTQTGNKYTEQVKAGVSEKRAGGIASVQGLAEAAVEFLGVDTFLKLRNGTFFNTLLRAANEGAQEGIQTFNENLFDKLWDKNQTLSEGVVESIIIGCLAGFPASVTVSVVEQSAPRGQAIKKAMKLGLSEKEAVAVVDGYIESAINHAKPVVDEALQAAAKKITLPLNIGASTTISQKTAPLKTTSGIGELVGTPQTVEGGVKPSPRFRLSLPAVSSPVAAISTQEASVPTPPAVTPPQIAPTQEELGKSIISGNGQITNDTVAAVLGDKTSLNWEQDGYALRIAYLGGERYAISKIPPVSTLPQAVQETPSPVAESAPTPTISKMETPQSTPAPSTEQPSVVPAGKPITPGKYDKTSGGPNVEMVSLDVLLPMAEFDRRTQPKYFNAGEEYLVKLREDIRVNGIKEPISIDYNENSGIAFVGEGNTRLMIARELGIKELPAYVIRSRSTTLDTKHQIGVNAVQLKPWENGYPYLGSTVSPTAVGIPSTTIAKRTGLGIGNNDNQPSPLSPSVTNTAPLPSGQTTSGEEVTPSYASNEPDLATSGTSQTIPADNESISRITVAFNKLADAKKAGGIKKQNINAFYRAMSEAGVPPKAIFWKKYHMIEHMRSPEKQMETVRAEVEKYNAKVLGKKITDIAHQREAKRAVKEAVALVKEQSEEQVAENGRILLEKAKKAVEGQKFGDQIELAKAKAHSDAIITALRERTKNQLKTQEWITATTNKRIKDARERKSILDHLKSLKLSRLPADIAMRIQEVTQGVKGAEKLFEQPTDTEFAYVLEKQGIEVKERPSNPVMAELDLPALRELWTHVRGLVMVGIEEKVAIKMAQRSQVEAAVDECTESLMKNTKPAQIPDVGQELQPVYKGNRVQEAITAVDNMFDRKQWQFQAADGYKRGALTWHLYDQLVEMEGYRIRTKNKLMEDYTAELKRAGINEKSYNAKRTLPNGKVITQAQAMFIAINAMSEQNLHHLRYGHNLQDDTIKQAIESLTKQEASFVDYMAKTERGAWARVNYTYEITHDGQSLPKIDNYVHIDIEKNDPFGKHDFADLTLEEMVARGFAKKATEQGFTKERAPMSGIRLREDPIFSFISYMMGATDYNFRAPVVKTLNGLVGDKVFAEAYTLRMGINGYKSLQKYVEHVANPSAALGLYGQEHTIDRIFRKTRGNAAVAILSARVSRFLTAGASYTTSISQFGIKAMGVGTAQVIAHPKATMEIVKNLMPVVYDRLTNPVRIEAEIADLQQKWGNKAERIKSAANILFRVADALDIQSAAIGGLAKFQALHPEWGIEKCAYEVQREIIATHSTDLIETKPGIYMQGELARGITMFTAEATAVSNYLGYLERGAIKGKIPKAKFLNAMFWSVAVLSQVMRLADWVGQGGKDDDEWWSTWWGAMVMSTIEATIPVFGNLITGSIEGRTYSLPVGFKFIETGTRSLSYFFDGNWEAGFKWAAMTAGYLLGAPVSAFTEFDRWVQTEEGQKPVQIDMEDARDAARPERPNIERPKRP